MRARHSGTTGHAEQRSSSDAGCGPLPRLRRARAHGCVDLHVLCTACYTSCVLCSCPSANSDFLRFHWIIRSSLHLDSVHCKLKQFNHLQYHLKCKELQDEGPSMTRSLYVQLPELLRVSNGRNAGPIYGSIFPMRLFLVITLQSEIRTGTEFIRFSSFGVKQYRG